jgi:hypothetical protein
MWCIVAKIVTIVDLTTPLSYCDRVQIRPPGDKQFALSPHVDGGGVERWEDQAYRYVYRKIFQGKVRTTTRARTKKMKLTISSGMNTTLGICLVAWMPI